MAITRRQFENARNAAKNGSGQIILKMNQGPPRTIMVDLIRLTNNEWVSYHTKETSDTGAGTTWFRDVKSVQAVQSQK